MSPTPKRGQCFRIGFRGGLPLVSLPSATYKTCRSHEQRGVTCHALCLEKNNHTLARLSPLSLRLYVNLVARLPRYGLLVCSTDRFLINTLYSAAPRKNPRSDSYATLHLVNNFLQVLIAIHGH